MWLSSPPPGVYTAAARTGARVAPLEPGTHVGGVTSGGLGYTDVGDVMTSSDNVPGLRFEAFLAGLSASPGPRLGA